VDSGKVALLGGMLAVGSALAVDVHSIGSSAAVVIASTRWVSVSEAAAVASEIEGTANTLASVAGSSMVA
jgi:hypothetical protein